jgi:mannose-1-phosphate guanylyltransferase
VVAAERTCVVVASQHERWWQRQLRSLPPSNIVVQPRNRGTAIGILLPLLAILRRDPQATLIVLPSDHFVRDERALAGAMSEAIARARWAEGQLILLGIDPQEADTELGYIVPGSVYEARPHTVREFIEKPDAATARLAIERGGLWNSFIFAVRARVLLAMFQEVIPELLMELADTQQRIASGSASQADLAVLYERLPRLDFSQDVIQRCPQRLRLLRVPACGWSDLGTPRRVADVLRKRCLTTSAAMPSPNQCMGFLDLAAQAQRQSA